MRLPEPSRALAWLLVAAVAVVLLVTCLHVAGLLVARAAAGWPETAIRVFTSRVVAAFGTLALLLAAVGIYGTLSYLVGARTREIGIRLALGASRRGIRSTVLWRGVAPAICGGVIGVGIAIALARTFRSLLFHVPPLDGWSIGGGVAVLLGVATLAALGPAHRAARIDPVSALRAE
jgi:ABC-type antimicrobial peptide transport system permease subunit